MSDLPDIPEDYSEIPLPPQAVEKWAEIERRARSEPVKRALRIALCMPLSHRKAARIAGVSPSTVWEAAEAYGITSLITERGRISGAHRRIAVKATALLEERLDEEGETMKPSELNFIAGTSTDKDIAYSRASNEAPQRESGLERVARMMLRDGGRIHLTMENAQGQRASLEATAEPPQDEGGSGYADGAVVSCPGGAR